MNAVFDQVAEHLQLVFGEGNLEHEEVTEILYVLACALVDEGSYDGQSIDHSINKFRDWPIITKALRAALVV